MTLPALELAARIAVGHMLNSLPESLLIVLCAALLLRVFGRRNSGTRFAVWMTALAAVVALPFVGTLGATSAAAPLHPEFTLPGAWAVGFFCLWAVAALVALARVAAGVLRVRSIRRHATEIDGTELSPELRQTLREHAAGRKVSLVVSDQVTVPTAIGFYSPAVVLPGWVLRDLSPEELRPILIHELTHLARRDDWTNLFQKAVRAVFCIHPAVWWLDARLATERELACDDAVLVATSDPRAYASSLLGLIEKSGLRRGWSMAQAAVGRACEATRRIARIISGGRPASTRISKLALGSAATLSAACCSLLLTAPRIVGFAPLHEPQMALAAPALAAEKAELATAAEPRVQHEARPAVVEAAWNPDAARNALHRQTRKAHRAAPARKMSRQAAPGFRLAQLEAPPAASAPMLPEPMLLMVATSFVQSPAVLPEAVSVPEGAAQPTPAAQFEAVQVVERRDATGLHVQVTRFVLIAPVQASASEAANRSI